MICNTVLFGFRIS